LTVDNNAEKASSTSMALSQKRDDTFFMGLALHQAARALLHDEVPVGAVIVHQNRVIGRGFNRVESKKEILRHAEITAIRQASKKLGRWRLTGCTMYTTLEPCCMCAGALVLARVDRLVYAASDPKAGACGSRYDIAGGSRLNHRIMTEHGLLQTEASQLLKDFFKRKRARD
jgi:tRNA(adenine34) deaminase